MIKILDNSFGVYYNKGTKALIAGKYDKELAEQQLKGAVTPERRMNLNLAAFGGAGEGATGGMMRIGGIFGMDVSNKIISLNQQMVDGINRLVQLNEQKTSSTANYTTLIGNP